jgi:hypothetical protein
MRQPVTEHPHLTLMRRTLDAFRSGDMPTLAAISSDDGFQWESNGTVAVEQSEWTMESCNEAGATRTRRVVRVELPQ